MTVWMHRLWPLPLALLCATVFYLAQRLPRPARAGITLMLGAVIALCPFWIAPDPRFLRLIGTLLAVTLTVKLYDLHHAAAIGLRLNPLQFAEHLFNPMSLVLRRNLCEGAPTAPKDLRQFVINSVLGAGAILLTIRVFEIHWPEHAFLWEHCTKAVSFFLIIQFVPNALSALFRLTGVPSTNFAGPFFLARTPAEFWRLYNRPAGQFLHEYIFKPAGGRHRPGLATLATFVFSGVVHEYVFDVPNGRALGTQMAFFLIQGLASVATIRLKPQGWLVPVAILATFAFNLLTVVLFLAGMNTATPFYVPR
jgi:hypothetical protein